MKNNLLPIILLLLIVSLTYMALKIVYSPSSHKKENIPIFLDYEFFKTILFSLSIISFLAMLLIFTTNVRHNDQAIVIIVSLLAPFFTWLKKKWN